MMLMTKVYELYAWYGAPTVTYFKYESDSSVAFT